MGYADDALAFERAKFLKDRMRDRQQSVTPQLADQLGRAYANNRNLNPEVTTSLVLAGASEDTVWKANYNQTLKLLKQGLDPFDGRADQPMTQPVEEDVEDEKDDGGFLGVVKNVSRGAFSVLDSVGQTIVNFASTTVPGTPNSMWDAFQEGDLWDRLQDLDVYARVVESAKATTLGQTVKDLQQGNDVDWGSGFFPAGQTAERRSEAERQFRGTVIGADGQPHAWTVGRGLADYAADWGVISRDSRMFDIASGLVDASVAIFADPTNYLPGVGWGDEVVDGMRVVRSGRAAQVANYLDSSDAALRAGDRVASERYAREAAGLLGASGDIRTMSPKLRQWRSVIADEIGLVKAGGVKTTTVPEMLKWLTTGRGRRIVEAIAKNGNAAEIMRLHGMKISPKLAKELADAQTPVEVAHAYAKAMENIEDGQAALKAVPGLGRSVMPRMGLEVRQKINGVVRWGNYFAGDTVLDPTDEIRSMQNLDRMLSTLASKFDKDTGMITNKFARYDMKGRNELLNDAIRAFADGSPAALFSFYDNLAEHFRATLVGLGWHPDDARKATEWSNQTGRLQEYTSYELVSGRDPLPFTINGRRVPIDPNQLLHGGVNIIDQAALVQAVRDQGRMATVLKQMTGDVRLRSVMPDDAERGGNLRYNTVRLPKVAVDSFLGFWKGITIAKIGYITKVVPEEILRVAASGGFDGPLDMMLASMRFRTVEVGGKKIRKAMRYEMDALARSWESAREYDALINLRSEIMEEADDLLKAGDQAGYDAAILRAEALTPQIDEAGKAAMSFEGNFNKALVGNSPDAAKEAITKDTTRYFARGVWTMVDKSVSGQRQQYVDGLYGALVKKSMSDVDRRIANRGLFDDDVLTLRRVSATWAEHVAAGRTANLTAEDAIATWMTNGGGKKWLDAYVTQTAGIDGSWNWKTRRGVMPLIKEKTKDIAYLTGADETAWKAARLDGADDDLLQLVATGTFRGRSPYVPDSRNGMRLTDPELDEYLHGFASTDQAPLKVRYAEAPKGTRAAKSEIGEIYQDAMSTFFRGMYGKSSDLLSRSPSFRRFYWKNVAALLPSATPDEAARLVANAEKAGLSPRLLGDIKIRARLARGKSTADDIDMTAKGFALDRVQNLLFDASKKGAFMDQMRLILPFGDAYKEVFTSWGKIIAKRQGRPLKSLGKGIRGMQGATGIGPGDMDGDGDRDGFMWKDPVSGDWRFSVPFSRPLVSAIAGTGTGDYPGASLNMDARSLNVLGNVMPGIGPFSDQLLNRAIPDTSQYDTLRDLLFPYGEPVDPEAPMSGNLFQRMVVPSWLRRAAALDVEKVPAVGGLLSYMANLLNDRENDPSYQITKNHVLKQLASQTNPDGTPEYPQSEAGMAALVRDAETVARRLYAMRGFVQFFTPAAPMSAYLAETKTGNVHAALVTEQLRDLEDQYADQGIPVGKAAVDIMDRFGPNVWLYTAANTKTKFPGTESTQAWWDWWRENKDVTETYPLVGSFFGPTGGSHSQDVYGAQSAAGLREPNVNVDMIREANSDLMLTEYYRLRDQLEADGTLDTEPGAQALRDKKAELQRQYGFSFDSVIADKMKESRDQMVQLQNMVAAYGTEPVATRLLDSPTGQRVADYMAARSMVIEETASRGLVNWQDAASTLDLRVALRSIGDQLSAEDPGFARLYQFVLRDEMKNDDEEVATAKATFARPANALSAPFATD